MNRYKTKKPVNALKESVKVGFVLTEEYKNTVRSASYLGKKGYTIHSALFFA